MTQAEERLRGAVAAALQALPTVQLVSLQEAAADLFVEELATLAPETAVVEEKK